MYLHASDKVAGVQNFQSAVGSKLIRRELVSKAVRQHLAPRHGLEPLHFQYSKPEKPLAVGLLGAGQQGRRLLAAAGKDFIAVKSVADIRPSNRARAAEAAKDAKTYNSYEELLKAAKSDGLEAVIIALPSHLHAEAALAALDAGLHVFVETPLALKVLDAKQVARKAANKKLVLAVGQQRHYNWIYDHALDMVRKDLLTQVHYIRSQWHLPKPEKGAAEAETEAKAKAAGKKKPQALKADEGKIDWWQAVPAADAREKFEGYDSPEQLVRWQLYEKYSGGLLAELGNHLFASAEMFLAATPNRDPQRPYPLSVTGTGSQILSDAAGDIDDHVHCIFEYAIAGYVDDPKILPKARKKIALQVDLIIGSEFDGYGETILGQQGSLVLESEQKAMLFHISDVDKNLRVVEKKNAKGMPGIEVPKDGKADEESQALGLLALQGADAGFATELEHWAFCCKAPADAKAKPLGAAEQGVYTTVLTVAAAKAVRGETRIDFEKEWFDVDSDKTPD